MTPLVKTLLTRGLPLVALYGIVLAGLNLGLIDDYLMATIATLCINIVLAVSLNLITGFTGQFSLGHAGFMAIGAYATGLITIAVPTVPGFIAGLLVGGLLSALIGFLIGLPTLRLRGDYLAIATLGLAEIIRIVLNNLEFTNGAAGLAGIPQLMDWNWFFILTVGSVILIRNFLRSRHSRHAIAVREDEIAAEAMGINLMKHKNLAFVISSFFTAISGGMLAMFMQSIDSSTFKIAMTYDILLIVVIGGIGSVTGSVFSAFLVTAAKEWWLRFFDTPLTIGTFEVPLLRTGFRMVVFSVLLMVVVLFYRRGLMGTNEFSWDFLWKKRSAAVKGGARGGK